MTYLAVPIAAKDVGVASLQINAASRAGAGRGRGSVGGAPGDPPA